MCCSTGVCGPQVDLRSPCTEEIAVFHAFAAAAAEGCDSFVVLDTAPTGHTVLLLDSALAYHREVTRQSNQMPETVAQLLPRLRDSHRPPNGSEEGSRVCARSRGQIDASQANLYLHAQFTT